MRLKSLASLSFLHLAAAAVPSIQWLDCHKHVPPVLDVLFPETNISILPPTLQCGHLAVPMDYSRPLGPNNTITLNLAMHRPENPKGVLFFCPGGTDPGAIIAWQIALNISSDFLPSFEGLFEYDIMIMDIRGTFQSNPLHVSLGAAGAVFRPYPTTLAEYRSMEQAAKTMFQSWEDLSQPPGIIQFVGTREVVQDYDSIRLALGYEKINFLGCSYGSYRAAAFAAKYPGRVGNFALDAIVPHGMDLTAQTKAEIAAANRGLLRADAFCQNNSSCPFHHAGKGSIPAAFQTILHLASNASLLTCTDDIKPCRQPISPYQVQSALAAALAGQPDFPHILTAFAAAVQGDGEGFTSPPSPPSQVLAGLRSMPLICNDYHIPNPTFAGYRDVLRAAETADTFNVSQSQGLFIQLICSAFPHPAPRQKVLRLGEKMLLVTADFDVSAATELSTFAFNHYRNSALVVRHGDDHVSFSLPQQESTAITKEFLRTGVLPRCEDDTSTTVYRPGTKRRPRVANPYEVPTGLVAGDVDSA